MLGSVFGSSDFGCFEKCIGAGVRLAAVTLKHFVAETAGDTSLIGGPRHSSAVTKDVWSGESPGGLSSTNLLAVTARHLFLIVFPVSMYRCNTSHFTQGNPGA